jgi:hypothetical protein
MNRLVKQSVVAAAATLMLGFFQLYDPDVFHNARIPSTTPPLSGLGGFFIDEGAGALAANATPSIASPTRPASAGLISPLRARHIRSAPVRFRQNLRPSARGTSAPTWRQ